MSAASLASLLAGCSFVAGLFEPLFLLGTVVWLVVAAVVRYRDQEWRPSPRQLISEEDLTQVAINVLRAKGTDRSVGLAAEIERGRERRRRGEDW